VKKKSKKEALQEAIALLEIRQMEEQNMLRHQFKATFESLKPINLLKGAWHDLTSSPDIKEDLMSNAIGLTTGFLSRRVLLGASRNPIKKIVGSLLQFAVANLVSRHSGTIKSAGQALVQRFFKHKREDGLHSEEEDSYNHR